MEKKKSIVTKVLGIFLLCCGIFVTLSFIIVGIALNLKNVLHPAALSDLGAPKYDCLALILPLKVYYSIAFLFFIFLTIAAVGIIRFKEWGRKILITLVGIEMLWLLGDCLFAKKSLDTFTAVTTLIWLGLLFYFTRHKVKEQFK